MLKNHASFRMILFSACFVPIANLSADVLSSTTTSDLVEPAGIYDNAAPNLLKMRVKTVIGAGLCDADNDDGCTLSDVLNDSDASDDFTPEIKVHMTADDFPDDGQVSNAKLRQRGASSRTAPQKSFRVKLDSSNTLWRGERRIQLVKSFSDFSRIRNKLSYDLFADIPNLPSMQTQFVNFEVEDQGEVEDYGLYTHVENFGKEYLVQRGWDKKSGVYKAENFYFKNDPAFALNSEGEPLDEDAFEKLMEIKRGDDHSEFVEMLQALNDSSLDFSQVFQKYFNKDNYLSWFAVNILLDNYDTSFHNFYLYNPKGTEKFYFVPWDYDLSLGALFDTNFIERTDLPRWTQSHANWWGLELHQRFLKQPGNLELLKEAVLEIKTKYLTKQMLQKKADAYYDLVFPVISSSPDIDKLYLGGTNPERIAAYNAIFSGMADKIEQNYNQFLEHFSDPMPFTLSDPLENANGSYTFNWATSESILGQTISYDIDISTTASFDDITFNQSGITGTRVTVPWNYASGRYFYRIIARDANAPADNWQVGYNELLRDGKPAAYGVVEFNASFDNAGNKLIARPDNAFVAANSSITIDVLANDLGTGLVLESSDQWSQKGAAVSLVNNKIRYKAKAGFTGIDRLWYVVKDSRGRTNYSVVTIKVENSSYPVGQSDNVTVEVNSSANIIDALDNDDGSGLTLVSSDPWSSRGGRVSIVNNRIVYKPKGNFIGVDKLWYVFKDSLGRTNSAKVTVTVNASYPVAYTDIAVTSMNTPFIKDVLRNDVGLSLRITEANKYSVKGGEIDITDGKLRYTPKSGYRGLDSFWYVIADSFGRTNAAKVTVTIN